MKPTEKEIEAAARVLCKESGCNPDSLHPKVPFKMWEYFADRAKKVLNAAYAVREKKQ